MNTKTPIFFCAVGGSGMLPLALLLKARGHDVRGSDRAYDQGRLPERFAFIQQQGIQLFPQDGSGVSEEVGQVVVSTAVEKTVPDYQAAIAKNIPIIHRAAMLASLFNQATVRIGVAGTSGKSTTTGMIGWLLHQVHKKPTIVNGAVMKNFVTDDVPFASAVVGNPDLFVAEVDESDGSIENFSPSIAVLNNIAVDHKTIDELRALFSAYIAKAQTIVLNLDNAEASALISSAKGSVISYSLTNKEASLVASDLVFAPESLSFTVTQTALKKQIRAHLRVPGRHNVSNALAALGTALAIGLDLKTATEALSTFIGMTRRMDVIGTVKNVTVIDDFAHNPDKITATLQALHQFDGRLIVFFQPHGFGPLRLMRESFVDCFSKNLSKIDLLFIPDPLYLGGTVDRSITSLDIVEDIRKSNPNVYFFPKREECAEAITKAVRVGDRVIVMGARDDSLPAFAQSIFLRIQERQ